MSRTSQTTSSQAGHWQPYREGWLQRMQRQAVTIARAVRAGRARAGKASVDASIDGEALRDLIAEAAEEALLLDVPVNRQPWRATQMRVTRGEVVTWLAWGRAYLIKPLGLGVGPSLGLLARVHGGPPQMSALETFTFTADRDGSIEVGGRFPGELREDGSITVDRLPYRVMQGGFTAVVAR